MNRKLLDNTINIGLAHLALIITILALTACGKIRSDACKAQVRADRLVDLSTLEYDDSNEEQRTTDKGRVVVFSARDAQSAITISCYSDGKEISVVDYKRH